MPQDEKTRPTASVRVGPVAWTVRDGALTGREALTPGVVIGNLFLVLFVLGLLGVALYLFLNGLDQTARYGPLHRDGPSGAGRNTSAGAAFGVGLIATAALGAGVVMVVVGMRRFPVVLRPDGLEVRVRSKWSGRVPVRLAWEDVADVHLHTAVPGSTGTPRSRDRVELVLRKGVSARNPTAGVVPTDDVVTVGPDQTAAVLRHFCQNPADRALLGTPECLPTAQLLAEGAR